MNAAMAAQYQYQQQQHRPQHNHHQQQPQRMPRGGSHATPQGRRGMQGVMPTPQQAAQQPRVAPQQSLRDAQEHATERYRQDLSRASGPQERNLPDGLEHIVIGNGVEEYKRLRVMERKLDAVMTRKRLELQDHRQKITPRTRKLRIWISNTAENQPWQSKALDENAFDFNSGVESTYKVTIVGKIIDEDQPEQKEGDEAVESIEKDDAVPNILPPKPKLSDLFKSITFELDRSRALQPDGANAVEWKKAQPGQRSAASPEFDSLQFERKGDENINCTILLLRDEQPERYSMAKPLRDLVCEEEATREIIISAIWLYVRKMGLQRDEDKRTIRLDETLRGIFGEYEHIPFPQIWQLITPHLTSIPPIKLSYTIRVDEEFQENPKPTVYDVMVAGPDPVHEQTLAIMQNPSFAEDLKKIKDHDRDIAALSQAISVSRNRHSFFNSMAKDPVTFLRRWVSSQKRDLEIIMGDSRTGSGTEWVSDEFRRGGQDSIWNSDNAKEAVDLLVNRPGRWGK